MSTAESINFGVGIMGQNELPGKITPPPVTPDSLIKWIESRNFDEKTTRRLIKEVRSFPSNTLHVFKANFNTILAKIQKEIQ